MEILHRFVRFGTRFHEAGGLRADPHTSPDALHDNEIVVDVGGVCWHYNDTRLPILDHHLPRGEDNFPCASCAVLHNIPAIRARFEKFSVVWIVTHQDADYDALCSGYLAKHAIEGNFGDLNPVDFRLHAEGWRDLPGGNRRIDWYAPTLAYLPKKHAWAFLLASVAAHVDNAKRMVCPPLRTLSSVLYARMERGVSFENTDGAVSFFDAARLAIESRHLNPLFDSIFEHDPDFEPELAMLDNAEKAYAQDLARARKVIVQLPVTSDFDRFFGMVKKEPLLRDGDAAPAHTDMTLYGQTFRQADAIYLKDPQCPLFHQLARRDAENSSFGQGFLFTAVAYSGQKTGPNSIRYIFSLDPERAQGAHLYPVWAELQAKELALLRKSSTAPPINSVAREGYEARAGKEPQLFADPWFDASNYRCTLVETPARGTLISSGELSDLSDDPVTRTVRSVIETALFAGLGHYTDFPTTEGEPQSDDLSPASLPPPLPGGCFRFARVPLAPDVDILHPGAAEQIGRRLFSTLHPEHRPAVPREVLHERLIVDRLVVGVWDASGVSVAYLPDGEPSAKAMEKALAKFSELSAQVHKVVDAESSDPQHTNAYRPLLDQVARLQWQLAQPDNRLLQRFFEATRFEQVVSLVHQLNSAATSEKHLEQIAGVQHNTELLEVLIVSVYATELAHVVAGEALHAVWPFLAILYYAAAAVGTGVATYWLSSRKGHSKKPLAFLAVWFVCLIAAGGWLGMKAHEEQKLETPVQALPLTK